MRVGFALLSTVAALGCATVTPLRIAQTPARLDAAALEGTWYVVGSTFPMWFDGSRREPRFTYGPPRQVGAQTRFDDQVGFVDRGGAPGTIDGEDTQHADVPTHFTWRGRGLLGLFKSEWDVVFLAPGAQWAIITFSATLATPAGLDVISRAAVLDATSWAAADAVIAGEPSLQALAVGLKRLP